VANSSHAGRPSVDPELTIRMRIDGHRFAIRPEHRLSEEVRPNLASRWFCLPGLETALPDYAGLSKERDGRVRQSAALRHGSETAREHTGLTGRFVARISPSTPASFAPTLTAPTLLLPNTASRVRSQPTARSLVAGPQSQPSRGLKRLPIRLGSGQADGVRNRLSATGANRAESQTVSCWTAALVGIAPLTGWI
jgi:Transposase domain (DUF772)